MKVKQKTLVFDNLLVMKGTYAKNKWYQLALEMRSLIIDKGLYTNSPMIYTYEKNAGAADEFDYTIYMPVNAELKVDKNAPYSFMKELRLENAFVFRLADVNDLAELETRVILEAAAESQNMKLVKPFYNICLNVFGETMLDIASAAVKNDAQ